MITQEQKLCRAGRIGSSDAAAILGLDPFKSAADVWLEKIGIADGFDGNENTDRGNRLEPVLIQWAEDQLAEDFTSDRMFIHPSNDLIANVDAISLDETAIIEAKTTVIEEGWGEEGTDQIPDRVQVQVAHQFVCIPSARIAWVPVLLPGFKKFDWRLYRVERNAELCEMVERRGLEFMDRFVRTKERPSDSIPSMEVLKRIRRVPNKTVELPEEVASHYCDACMVAATANKTRDDAKAALIDALGDAECGTWGELAFTYMAVKRKGYTIKPTEYRKLMMKKKEGDLK
jgi:putative phage-type endonuclease